MGELALYVARLYRLALESSNDANFSPSSGSVNAFASYNSESPLYSGEYRASHCAVVAEHDDDADAAAVMASIAESPRLLTSSVWRRERVW